MTVLVDREHRAREADQQLREAEREQLIEAEAEAVAGGPE